MPSNPNGVELTGFILFTNTKFVIVFMSHNVMSTTKGKWTLYNDVDSYNKRIKLNSGECQAIHPICTFWKIKVPYSKILLGDACSKLIVLLFLF